MKSSRGERKKTIKNFSRPAFHFGTLKVGELATYYQEKHWL